MKPFTFILFLAASVLCTATDNADFFVLFFWGYAIGYVLTGDLIERLFDKWGGM